MPTADRLVWDNHGCLPLRPGDDRFMPQLARYRQGGGNVVTLNVAWDGMPTETGVQMLSGFRRWLRRYPDDYLLVQTADDLDLAVSTGRLGVLFDIEGGVALAGRLEMVSLYYDLGVRWMSLAYNQANALGGGILDDRDAGLTEFGRAVVDEMARVGMVVCCTHVGHRTAMEVIERTADPVIFSHSNPNAVYPHVRNIGDELIHACARKGGVIGINGIGEFLGQEGATIEAIVRHASYVADLVGPEHVALGLDYVFDLSELEELVLADPERFPWGWDPAGFPMVKPEQLGAIADALLRGGWDDMSIGMILGGNLRRIARQVWNPVG